MLPGDRLVCVEARAILDLVHGQRQAETVGRPFDLTERDGRDEDSRPTEDAAGLDDEIANYPTLIIQEKIHDTADVAIGGVDSVSFEIF
jgi:hypothetical protein